MTETPEPDKPLIPLLSDDGVTMVPVTEEFLTKLRETWEHGRTMPEPGSKRVSWVPPLDEQ